MGWLRGRASTLLALAALWGVGIVVWMVHDVSSSVARSQAQERGAASPR